MPFCLTNAPRTFQRSMHKILEQYDFTKIYIDDILIFSKDAKTHLEHVETIFNELNSLGISINFEKSHFFQKEIKFLGHILDEKGIKADKAKLMTALETIQIKTKKDVRKLLGLLNWFRPFLPRLSENLQQITSLLKGQEKKGRVEISTKDVQSIIAKVCNLVSLNIQLAFPDEETDFDLYTDASNYGFGAILTQKNKIVGLYSGKFSSTQVKYTTTEKEFYSIVRSIMHFYKIIYGYHTVIHTDHKNLIFDMSNQLRVERWKLYLQGHNLTYKHVQGDKNPMADLLSRSFNSEQNIKSCYIEIDTNMYADTFKQLINEIKNAQLTNDKTLQQKLMKLHTHLGHIGRIR